MPELARFFGIKVMMYAFDNRQHHLPHIHVQYQEDEAVLELPNGNLLTGDLPSKKLRMVQTWMDIHEEELMQCWDMAINGHDLPTIEPLR